MTSPKAKARDYLADLPDDWQVPDPPPKEPDMQQDISLFDFEPCWRPIWATGIGS